MCGNEEGFTGLVFSSPITSCSLNTGRVLGKLLNSLPCDKNKMFLRTAYFVLNTIKHVSRIFSNKRYNVLYQGVLQCKYVYTKLWVKLSFLKLQTFKFKMK